MLQVLKDDFFFIVLSANKDKTAEIIAQRDKGEPVLYNRILNYTDCPYSEKPYNFCLDCNSEIIILCLLGEY